MCVTVKRCGCASKEARTASLASSAYPFLIRPSCAALAAFWRVDAGIPASVRPATLAKLSRSAGPRARWPCCIAACRQHKHGACHFSASSTSGACPRFLLLRAGGIVRRSFVRLSPRSIFVDTGLDTGDVRPRGIGGRVRCGAPGGRFFRRRQDLHGAGFDGRVGH